LASHTWMRKTAHGRLRTTIVKWTHPGVAITPRWQGMSRSIEIPAPTIRMRVISANGIHDGDPINGLAHSSLITGMCIHTECGNTGLRPYVTWFADLFSAPLSAEQEHAIVVLDTIASYDYWLQVALRNGVIGMTVSFTMHTGGRCARSRTPSIPIVPRGSRSGQISWALNRDSIDETGTGFGVPREIIAHQLLRYIARN